MIKLKFWKNASKTKSTNDVHDLRDKNELEIKMKKTTLVRF